MSVGQKLGLGLAVMIGLIVAPAALSYKKVRDVQHMGQRVLDVEQPRVSAARAIREGIAESQAGLRGFVAVRDEAFKTQRTQGWKKVAQNLGILAQTLDAENDKDRATVGLLRAELAELQKIQKTVEEVCGTDANLPGVKIVVSETTPRRDTMVAVLNEMIGIETTLAKTPKRTRLMEQLSGLRASVMMALLEMHGYLTTGEDRHAKDFRKYWDANVRELAALETQAWLFTPRQKELFGRYRQIHREFEEMPPRLFAMRESDTWNVAQGMLREDSARREAQTVGLVQGLVARQERAAQRAKHAYESQGALLTAINVGGPGLAAILAIFLAYSITRRITRPLNETVAAMETVASGQLGEPLSVDRDDEFGRLASAINAVDERQAALQSVIDQMVSTSKQVQAETQSVLRLMPASVAALTPQVAGDDITTDESAADASDALRDMIATSRGVQSGTQRVARLTPSADSSPEGPAKSQAPEASVSADLRILTECSQRLNDQAAKLAQLAAGIQGFAVPSRKEGDSERAPRISQSAVSATR